VQQVQHDFLHLVALRGGDVVLALLLAH
jgi:hypothetical protein